MKNGVIMQYFEWQLPNNGNLWNQLKDDAAHLHEIGITAVWLPPPTKATSTNDPGYGAYDLYDLGEFDQQGSVRTKYGSKQELIKAIEELHKHGVAVYMDAVMNHKAGADYTEKFTVREVDPSDRNKYVSDAYEIEGWTGFEFPGRSNRHSAFKWHWHHFSGIDFNQANGKFAIYRIQGEGKTWSNGVDTEKGNSDYLIFADIDFAHPDVIEEMKGWGVWVTNELDLDGMRVDTVKHIDRDFVGKFLENIRKKRSRDFYAVGEYWKRDLRVLKEYLAATGHKIDLFDVPLHYNMHQVSVQGVHFDMRQMFDQTLVKDHPELAVTFVDNHDSQPGGVMYNSYVTDWFKPSAYALILLMKSGYPCIFYGDYYGTKGSKSPHQLMIDILLNARRKYAFGEQHDYFDHANTIGLVRMGDQKHPGSGLALLISNGENGSKTMQVGQQRKGEVWHEFSGNIAQEVTIDEHGNGEFFVEGGTLAVWVKK